MNPLSTKRHGFFKLDITLEQPGEKAITISGVSKYPLLGKILKKLGFASKLSVLVDGKIKNYYVNTKSFVNHADEERKKINNKVEKLNPKEYKKIDLAKIKAIFFPLIPKTVTGTTVPTTGILPSTTASKDTIPVEPQPSNPQSEGKEEPGAAEPQPEAKDVIVEKEDNNPSRVSPKDKHDAVLPVRGDQNSQNGQIQESENDSDIDSDKGDLNDSPPADSDIDSDTGDLNGPNAASGQEEAADFTLDESIVSPSNTPQPEPTTAPPKETADFTLDELIAPFIETPQSASAITSPNSVVLPNGNTYEGELVDGQPSGNGKEFKLNKNAYTDNVDKSLIYSGNWLNGQRHGQGTEYDGKRMWGDPKEVYKGNFENGMRHGQGTEFEDGFHSYVGDFDRGQKSGQGAVYKKNKKIYEGGLLNGVHHGKGQLFLLIKGAKNKQAIRYEDRYSTRLIYDGEFQHGVFHGIGKKIEENGDEYSGAFVNGMFHGVGHKIEKNGDEYSGPFEGGKKHGPNGTLTRSVEHKIFNTTEKRTETLTGDWENDELEGKGKVTLKKESGELIEEYEGDLKAGARHGAGTLLYFSNVRINGVDIACKIIYEGDFVDGKMQGVGKLSYYRQDDESILVRQYQGAFSDNRLNGQGIHIDTNGDRYEGEFKDGKPDGHGELTEKNGNVYVGNFHQGLKSGEGTLTFGNIASSTQANDDSKLMRFEGEFNMDRIWKGKCTYEKGETFEGDFEAGSHRTRLKGTGKLTDTNGNVYEGKLKDGKLFEKGTLTRADGTVYYGDWDGDNFVKGSVKNNNERTEDELKILSSVTWYSKYPEIKSSESLILADGGKIARKYNQKGLITSQERFDKSRTLTTTLRYLYDPKMIQEGTFDKNNKLEGKGRIITQKMVYAGIFKSGIKHGLFNVNFIERKERHKGLYQNDKKTGKWAIYKLEKTPEGKLIYNKTGEGHYLNDLRNGEWSLTRSDGSPHKVLYKDGVEIKSATEASSQE